MRYCGCKRVANHRQGLIICYWEYVATCINSVHKNSLFNHEPVSCVQFVKSELVTANDYNPNSMAPPEMKLLEHSIKEDGYTQPIVSWSRSDAKPQQGLTSPLGLTMRAWPGPSQ